jgi:hypothetical protein
MDTPIGMLSHNRVLCRWLRTSSELSLMPPPAYAGLMIDEDVASALVKRAIGAGQSVVWPEAAASVWL